MDKAKLSSNQLRAILCILESSSIEEASKRANISRATIYNWNKDGTFREKLEKERNAIFNESMNLLKQATMMAVKELINLLKSEDESCRRLVAKEIINISLKRAEEVDFEERIARIEKIVEKNDGLSLTD